MDDENLAFQEGPRACPFVAFDDDRDRRSDRPDYRHRCFASPQPEPRAYPHQERYCLSAGFTDCPIFLEWARREGATAVAGRRPMPAATGAGAAGAGVAAAAAEEGTADGQSAGVPAGYETDDEGDVPAFLAGRSRAAQSAPAEPAPRGDASDGLWGAAPQASPKRRPAGPVTGTARPNSRNPEWERPMRMEAYPRLRSRSFSLSPGLLVALLAVVAVVAAFLVVPRMFPSGTSGSPNPTAALTTPSPSATPAPTPTPAPTASKTYIVKSGDTLFGIATKLGITQQELVDANPQIKNPDILAVGDVLNVPRPSASPSAGQ